MRGTIGKNGPRVLRSWGKSITYKRIEQCPIHDVEGRWLLSDFVPNDNPTRRVAVRQISTTVVRLGNSYASMARGDEVGTLRDRNRKYGVSLMGNLVSATTS